MSAFRKSLWALVAVVVLVAAPAASFAGDPYLAQYNYNRAYRHFLSSPSPYKVFSSSRPGYTVVEEGPLGYHRFTLGESYEQQRIHRRGFERYRLEPGYEVEEASPFYYRYQSTAPVESYEHVPHPRMVPAPAYPPLPSPYAPRRAWPR